MSQTREIHVLRPQMAVDVNVAGEFVPGRVLRVPPFYHQGERVENAARVQVLGGEDSKFEPTAATVHLDRIKPRHGRV